ncbi:hypothetical protein GUJ93_ZPchr0011g27605 [Zizania palustris]|uniref:Plastid lipid-associated protein/fibrillin conserved domain-containing protein n=1 Tax=Zizania palustris TaxID=103762 RepID=A0A8J5WKM5_ZIZPA|nr:hypothetical protein GUJ93_ZPchr0011g27605 [Zizania palustris]
MAAVLTSSCCASTSTRPLVRPAGRRSGMLLWASGGKKPRVLSICATAAPSPVEYDDTGAGAGSGAGDDAVALLKVKLLSAVSGLNRGLAASQEDLDRADAAARELEAAAGGPIDLDRDLDKLQGRWRLVYSSAFSSRTLGGSRPGPPTGRLLPITLGQVFQRIDVVSKDFDNIVELELGAPWPLPPVELTATLAHKFEIIGESLITQTRQYSRRIIHTKKPNGQFLLLFFLMMQSGTNFLDHIASMISASLQVKIMLMQTYINLHLRCN